MESCRQFSLSDLVGPAPAPPERSTHGNLVHNPASAGLCDDMTPRDVRDMDYILVHGRKHTVTEFFSMVDATIKGLQAQIDELRTHLDDKESRLRASSMQMENVYAVMEQQTKRLSQLTTTLTGCV